MTSQQKAADSLWTVVLRCSFFRGEIKSAKILRSSGNAKVDAQALDEMLHKHVPEVAFGTRRHEYWRTLNWTLPKPLPYAEPLLPQKLAEPEVLVGVPFLTVCAVSAPVSSWWGES